MYKLYLLQIAKRHGMERVCVVYKGLVRLYKRKHLTNVLCRQQQEEEWRERVRRMGAAAAGKRSWPGCTALAVLIQGNTLLTANAGQLLSSPWLMLNPNCACCLLSHTVGSPIFTYLTFLRHGSKTMLIANAGQVLAGPWFVLMQLINFGCCSLSDMATRHLCSYT